MAYVSFRLCLCLLFGIQYSLIAEGQGRIVETHALIGQQVNLTCYLNSTEDVTWLYNTYRDNFVDIYTCQYNGQCTSTNIDEPRLASLYSELNLQATQRNETSILSLKLSEEEQHDFRCKLGNYILQEYSVIPFDPLYIVPNCIVTLPSNNTNGVGGMTLSCEVNLGTLNVNVNLTLEGIGRNVLDDSPGSSQRIKAKTLYFDDFKNIHNVSCNAYFPDIDITQSCTYPNIIKAQYIVEGNDIIIECDDASEFDDWRFYGSDGREEDIKDRSWIRDGGLSLLIREISGRDVGKVVVCRTKGYGIQTNNSTIGFHVISKMYGGNNKSNSEDSAPTKGSAHNAYLVLTLFFLTLWLITTAVFGVLLGCRTKRNQSGTSTIALASGNASVPNGGSGERETPLLNVGTGARGDPNTLNTNNSAHNPAFEPEVNIADENNRNRQSNNESHLYFTLEKSSPSPVNSLLRASTERWEQPDANPASLNHPQRESSHSQCYETVGEPSEGATISYDLGEYAEVGGHFQGKGPPDLGEYAEVRGHFQGKGPPDLLDRPSVRKKPERKKVKEDDISRLYSKVNK